MELLSGVKPPGSLEGWSYEILLSILSPSIFRMKLILLPVILQLGKAGSNYDFESQLTCLESRGSQPTMKLGSYRVHFPHVLRMRRCRRSLTHWMGHRDSDTYNETDWDLLDG